MATERIEVTGIVQGVGFRPFVHRLACALGLRGFVGNDSSQVFIEVAGSAELIDRFVERLRSEAPPLAVIETVTRRPSPESPTESSLESLTESSTGAGTGTGVEARAGAGFHIVESRDVTGAVTLVPPDTAVCRDCLREMADPADRRFRHPFVTCTNCGPRFTLITAMPYDRPNTTMARFAMCRACETEYTDPTDRRHHAHPISCHDCGPTLRFLARPAIAAADGTASGPVDAPWGSGPDPIALAARALGNGDIVAIKGIGGYHLACDAADDVAVAKLRSRKHRPDKPFAVMVADVAQAMDLAVVEPAEAQLLQSDAAPIVLLRARPDAAVSTLVAPGNPLIGCMVAYSPVHHLLLEAVGRPLVMTSANRSGEPLACRGIDLERLGDLHDAVLDHDRDIDTPCDDSVVRVVEGRLLPIRRARGYAPIPVRFEKARRAVLAVGGELKNTFCVAAGDHAWVSQHIGDMENLETQEAFEQNVERFLTMYRVEPAAVAADLHPAYLSSRWARSNHRDRLVEVQHHHAHVAAIMAEHRLDPHQPILGFAFDGTGYGSDGSIWGGELLLASVDRCDRLAHLEPIPLPGGDAAIANPGRSALAHLHAADIAWSPDLAPVAHLGATEQTLLLTQLERGFACIPTTSMGRLFDAVAALLGHRQVISYEAQAAIELEISAIGAAGGPDSTAEGPDPTAGYRFEADDGVLSARPVIRQIVEDLAGGVDRAMMALRFHVAVADAVVQLARRYADRTGITTVALSGGVFQNALLTTLCARRLTAADLRPLTHRLVPPNDGGLALGQAYIVSHQDQKEA